jgi:hypothetical protein
MYFPSYALRTKIENGKEFVFDTFRAKWVVLTPEEFVRQHVLRYLAEEKGFPEGLTSVEKSLSLNGTFKRCDILYSNREGQAIFLVECKAPEVPITQQSFDQIIRYNMVLNVWWLLVTNGVQVVVAFVQQGNVQFVKEIPNWTQL